MRMPPVIRVRRCACCRSRFEPLDTSQWRYAVDAQPPSAMLCQTCERLAREADAVNGRTA